MFQRSLLTLVLSMKGNANREFWNLFVTGMYLVWMCSQFSVLIYYFCEITGRERHGSICNALFSSSLAFTVLKEYSS